jgi:hypothetical protein
MLIHGRASSLAHLSRDHRYGLATPYWHWRSVDAAAMAAAIRAAVEGILAFGSICGARVGAWKRRQGSGPSREKPNAQASWRRAAGIMHT